MIEFNTGNHKYESKPLVLNRVAGRQWRKYQRQEGGSWALVGTMWCRAGAAEDEVMAAFDEVTK